MKRNAPVGMRVPHFLYFFFLCVQGFCGVRSLAELTKLTGAGKKLVCPSDDGFTAPVFEPEKNPGRKEVAARE